MTDHKPKYARSILVLVILIIVAILGWSLLKTDEVERVFEEDGLELVQDGGKIEAVNYEYIKPQEWEFYDNAMKDIQVLAEGQQIQLGIVRDPVKENFVYFASTTQANENNEVLLSIYKYNENDYSFDRLWRETATGGLSFKIESENFVPVMYVVGYENGKLIVTVMNAD